MSMGRNCLGMGKMVAVVGLAAQAAFAGVLLEFDFRNVSDTTNVAAVAVKAGKSAVGAVSGGAMIAPDAEAAAVPGVSAKVATGYVDFSKSLGSAAILRMANPSNTGRYQDYKTGSGSFGQGTMLVVWRPVRTNYVGSSANSRAFLSGHSTGTGSGRYDWRVSGTINMRFQNNTGADQCDVVMSQPIWNTNAWYALGTSWKVGASPSLYLRKLGDASGTFATTNDTVVSGNDLNQPHIIGNDGATPPATAADGRIAYYLWTDDVLDTESKWEQFYGDYLYPDVWHVKVDATGTGTGRDWANAFTNVQDALSAVRGSEDEIWVAGGRYLVPQTLVVTTSFTRVYGGFAGTETQRDQRNSAMNPTLLDGGGVRQVMNIASNNLVGLVLDGLTFAGGYLSAAGTGAPARGAGLYAAYCSGELRNCRFVDNVLAGGSVASEITQGAGAFLWYGNWSVSNCEWLRNTGANFGTSGGGGLYALYGTNNLATCVFAGNTVTDGGGLYGAWGGIRQLVNCVLAGNVADDEGGGLCVYRGMPQTVNCTFYRNRQSNGRGAAIRLGYWAYNTSVIQNNLFAENSRTAISELDATDDPTVLNNLFFNNGGTDYSDIDSATDLEGAAEVNTLCVPDNASGNVDGDPRFVGGPSGTWTSVAYDAATRQTTLTDATAAFSVGGLAGAFVVPDLSRWEMARAVGNDATHVTVWGDYTAVASAGDGYRVMDLRIRPGSPCVDAALSEGAPVTDFDGTVRPILNGIDIGAFEAPLPNGTLLLMR